MTPGGTELGDYGLETPSLPLPPPRSPSRDGGAPARVFEDSWRSKRWRGVGGHGGWGGKEEATRKPYGAVGRTALASVLTEHQASRQRGDEMGVLKGTCIYHYLPLNLRAQHPMAEGGQEHYCMGTLSKLSRDWNTINLPTLI